MSLETLRPSPNIQKDPQVIEPLPLEIRAADLVAQRVRDELPTPGSIRDARGLTSETKAFATSLIGDIQTTLTSRGPREVSYEEVNAVLKQAQKNLRTEHKSELRRLKEEGRISEEHIVEFKNERKAAKSICQSARMQKRSLDDLRWLQSHTTSSRIEEVKIKGIDVVTAAGRKRHIGGVCALHALVKQVQEEETKAQLAKAAKAQKAVKSKDLRPLRPLEKAVIGLSAAAIAFGLVATAAEIWPKKPPPRPESVAPLASHLKGVDGQLSSQSSSSNLSLKGKGTTVLAKGTKGEAAQVSQLEGYSQGLALGTNILPSDGKHLEQNAESLPPIDWNKKIKLYYILPDGTKWTYDQDYVIEAVGNPEKLRELYGDGLKPTCKNCVIRIVYPDGTTIDIGHSSFLTGPQGPFRLIQLRTEEKKPVAGTLAIFSNPETGTIERRRLGEAIELPWPQSDLSRIREYLPGPGAYFMTCGKFEETIRRFIRDKTVKWYVYPLYEDNQVSSGPIPQKPVKMSAWLPPSGPKIGEQIIQEVISGAPGSEGSTKTIFDAAIDRNTSGMLPIPSLNPSRTYNTSRPWYQQGQKDDHPFNRLQAQASTRVARGTLGSRGSLGVRPVASGTIFRG